jgi:hypothetical protein
METRVALSNTPAVDFGPGFPLETCAAPFWFDPFGFVPLIAGEVVVLDS